MRFTCSIAEFTITIRTFNPWEVHRSLCEAHICWLRNGWHGWSCSLNLPTALAPFFNILVLLCLEFWKVKLCVGRHVSLASVRPWKLRATLSLKTSPCQYGLYHFSLYRSLLLVLHSRYRASGTTLTRLILSQAFSDLLQLSSQSQWWSWLERGAGSLTAIGVSLIDWNALPVERLVTLSYVIVSRITYLHAGHCEHRRTVSTSSGGWRFVALQEVVFSLMLGFQNIILRWWWLWPVAGTPAVRYVALRNMDIEASVAVFTLCLWLPRWISLRHLWKLLRPICWVSSISWICWFQLIGTWPT